MKTFYPCLFVVIMMAGCASYEVEFAAKDDAAQTQAPQPTPSSGIADAENNITSNQTTENETITITAGLSEINTNDKVEKNSPTISGTIDAPAVTKLFTDLSNGQDNKLSANFGAIPDAGSLPEFSNGNLFTQGDTAGMGMQGEPGVTSNTSSNPRNNFPTTPVLSAAKPVSELSDLSSIYNAESRAPQQEVQLQQMGRARHIDQLNSLGYTTNGGTERRVASWYAPYEQVPKDKNVPIEGLVEFNKTEDLSLIKRPQTPGTEEYDAIEENPFQFVSQNPLSTFSVDVDTASYSNIRRFIMDNQLPPKDAVRIEELVNYFTYDYPQPDDEQPFAVYTEVAQSPWNPQNKLVHVGLQGKSIPTDNLPYSNLVFLLDVSGSMKSANKLPLVKSAFKLLMNQMRPGDRVAVVTYAGRAGLALPSTSGNQKDKLLEVIDKLEAGGSTAGGEGIQLAYKIAKENYVPGGNNRVILATDGDFNVGVSDTDELVRLIEEKRKDGIFLTITGFGTGNLKDEKMESLADKGNGNYAYIDSLMEAKKVFVSEMGGTFFTIAKDVKIQVEFNPAKVKAYRLIGYENRILQDRDFNDDTKDAGEIGSGHTVTALYEIVTPNSDFALPEVDALKYQEVVSKVNSDFADELMTVKLRYKKPDEDTSKLTSVVIKNNENDDESDNMKFSTAVAQFGMLLRGSSHSGEASFENVIAMAKEAKGKDDEGYRAEFIRLVEMAELLHSSETVSTSYVDQR